MLEDLGTWLVTDPKLEPLRRLLRFAGPTFADFVQSLEELGDRGRLAMPDLDMPDVALERIDPTTYRLKARWTLPGIAPILLGCLQAMADDYGALVMMKLDGFDNGAECLQIQLFDAAFAEGRQFTLGQCI